MSFIAKLDKRYLMKLSISELKWTMFEIKGEISLIKRYIERIIKFENTALVLCDFKWKILQYAITFSQILFCIQIWFACLITSCSFILLFSVVTFSWPHANEFLSPTFVVLCLFRVMEVVTVDDDSSTSLDYTFICLTIFFVSYKWTTVAYSINLKY